MGTAISCTKCNQMAGLIQKVGRSSLEAYESGFAWKQYLVSDHDMSLPSALVCDYRKHRGVITGLIFVSLGSLGLLCAGLFSDWLSLLLTHSILTTLSG